MPGVDFGVKEVRGEFPEELEIRPLKAPVDASVRVPGSKSVTNRALVICALAAGTSTLENLLFCDDTFWLMSALVDLGFEVRLGDGGEVRVAGLGGTIPAKQDLTEIFVGNAGTVARFLPPALALGEGVFRVDGVARMRQRPVADLVSAMHALGAKVEYGGEEGHFPLVVGGGGLKGGRAKVRGTRSSQFLSGVMISAPYAGEPVTLEVEGGLVHASYVGITRSVMRDFGIEVEEEGRAYRIPQGVYRPRTFAVEPDASGASYFFAAAAASGGRVRVEGLGEGSTQGDLRFVEVLGRMGCEVEVGEDFVEVRGPERLRGVEVDMNDFSDTFITLAAIAPFADSPTKIKNVEHTRQQETDRISAVATELHRLGVGVEERRDGLEIFPGEVEPALVRTYDDHRMAMAFAVTGLRAAGIRLENPSCVTKTFPDFFERLERLGS